MKLAKRMMGLTFILFVVVACSSMPVVTTVTEPTAASSVGQIPEPITATSPSEKPAFNSSLNLEPVPVAGRYQFAEGPATDQTGNVYFSDIIAGKIYMWSPNSNVTVFQDGLNMPNGLMFDGNGNLIACEGGNGRLISIAPQGGITVLVDQYNGVRFNEPNDLWIDPQGGIYFTDPAYQSPVIQDGENVYYLSPDRHQVIRVIDDMVRPNGIVGTDNGTTLYVADHGASQTFSYTINSDGTLSNKQLLVSIGSDGMTLDAAGNLYLTIPNQIQIYNSTGIHLKDIPMQENPTNVTFAGPDSQTMFVTARTAVYTVQMPTERSSAVTNPVIVSNPGTFTLSSSDVAESGRLPVEYTCDGVSSTLALSWTGAPAGTKSFAVIMHHVASPEDIHWYMVLYNIPAHMTSLPMNFVGIGTLGTNSVNDRTEYAPPCSKGPGDKIYTYTVYALSAQPQLSVPDSQVTRAVLLEAMQDITLASAELNVVYARP
jgi:gluconolactonase